MASLIHIYLSNMKHLISFLAITFWVAIFFSSIATGQSYFEGGLKPEFHKGRREALRSQMPENSVAVFFTQPVKVRSMDTHFDYRPDSDFYYLTGFREPNAALIIFKEEQELDGVKSNEWIFVQPKDARAEMWDGERLGVSGVQEKLGFKHVFVNSSFFESRQLDLSSYSQVLCFDAQQIESGSHNATLKNMIQNFRNAHPENMRSSHKALNDVMDQLRVTKTPEELAILKNAIEISGRGHIEAMKSIQPGVSERSIQGVHEFVHKALDAEAPGYGSIVGANNNSTVLHYVYNSKKDLKDGVILMDVGAEYRGYTGDITRTVPIKGVFNEEQAAIYNLVLEAMEASITACGPDATFYSLSRISQKIIDTGLEELGIIKKNARHPYFPHGIGHHLGLDVHDRGGYSGKLAPGMVLTIEPGIYIPEGSDCDPKWWGIGIRIEDNILITESGYENLSSFVPKTIEEIESLMKQEGILQKLRLESN